MRCGATRGKIGSFSGSSIRPPFRSYTPCHPEKRVSNGDFGRAGWDPPGKEKSAHRAGKQRRAHAKTYGGTVLSLNAAVKAAVSKGQGGAV